MDKNNRVRKIVNAPLFNRTFGAIIDLVLTIFVGAGLYLGISKIAENVGFIKAYKDDYYQTIVESGLMYESKGEVVPYEYDNYEEYQNRFYTFYNDYFAKKTENSYDVYWFNVFIYGQNDGLNRYESKDLEARPKLVKEIGASLFTYKVNDANEPQYEEFALPIESNNGAQEVSNPTKQKLRNYFYVADEETENNTTASKYGTIYIFVLNDLVSLTKLQNDYKNYAFFSATLPLAIAVFVTFMVFYLIIPLCFKNGQSIGKKIMHTCLVNKLGYEYSRLQLIPRFIFPAFLMTALVLIIGFSIWPFLIISGVLLISYLFVVFTKDNKALHDYFAGTLVIDARESTWFKDINEEEKTQKEVDEYVETVRNKEDPTSKDNIIYTNPHFKDKK